MNKKTIRIIVSIIIVIGLIMLINRLIWNYKVAHAEKIVELGTNKVLVFESDARLSQLIKTINGNLDTDPIIDTSKIGKQTIEFKYTTDEGYPVKHQVEIEVVDVTPPTIFMSKNKTIYTDYDGILSEELFCGDNYDSNPKCTIEGEYDTKTPGEYELMFIGKDSSGNKMQNRFTLTVKERPKITTSASTKTTKAAPDKNTLKLETLKEKYKDSNVEFGIDVSHWEGDIDFKKVKKAGVDFVYIRVGRGNGIGKEYVEDSYFKKNIEGFNKVGIPVGVYFYSNANSIKDAEKEAKWILKKIKDYKVDLEIVYDWEDWQNFQEYDLSFHELTETANAFTKTIDKAGYKGMVYGSKHYLENIWEELDGEVWLAHYTEQTNYQGKYSVWQICEDGHVDGISTQVDINLRYPNKNKG